MRDEARKMEKQLSLKYPPIDTKNPHAFTLSAILNYEDALPWFYCNYIQMIVWKGELDFLSTSIPKTNPWIQSTYLHRDLVQKWHFDIIKFIIECIDENYFVTTNVNQFYIPETECFNKVHYKHENLVYGYNLERKVFYIAGFFKNAKYRIGVEVSFENFEKAFRNIEVTQDYMDNVDIYRFPYFGENNKVADRYDFDLMQVIDSLSDYLFSKNSIRYVHQNQNNLQFISGLDSYEAINEQITFLQTHGVIIRHGEGITDYQKYILRTFETSLRRSLHIIWNHKTCMMSRITFMVNNGYLKNSNDLLQSYDEIANDALLARNIFLKFIATNKIELLDKIMNIIEKIKIKEKEAIERILENIIMSKIIPRDSSKLDDMAYYAR